MKNNKKNNRPCKKLSLKIGLYNPYLDVLGGGEKHILSILQVLAEVGADISIFWNKNLSKEINERFSLQCFKTSKWLPLTLKNLQTLKTFDYFFYITDGSYFFSLAKKNFVFSMVPNKKLYNLNLLNRLKLWNYKFISNSSYTTKWLKKWGINPITIPPYIDSQLFLNKKIKKEKIILSVGRFFPHLHSKNQEKIIQSFKQLKNQDKQFSDYKLILVGGLKKEDQQYFNQLKNTVKNNQSIIFKPNISFNELKKLYKVSTYFWHFTGLGIDEEKYPEQVEHFGIAPLEAIASGCLTFCHNSGGPKETISDKKTGFLFNNEKELIEKMIMIEKNNNLKRKITRDGVKYIKDNFNYQVFKEKVLKL